MSKHQLKPFRVGRKTGPNKEADVASASLQMDNSGAFLLPRMTTAERDALTPVTAGLTIYNTTTNTVNTYTGSAWGIVSSTNTNGTLSVPSFTTGERDLLTGLAAGQLIYNSTTGALNLYNGSSWLAVTAA